MITGIVRNKEALLELEVSVPTQQPQRIEVVVDTGYNGQLTLPDAIIAASQLTFVGHRRGMLADGTIIVLDVYLARVLWHGRPKDVLAVKAAGSPLIGMSLLEGNRLTMDVVDGGQVLLEELP